MHGEKTMHTKCPGREETKEPGRVFIAAGTPVPVLSVSLRTKNVYGL